MSKEELNEAIEFNLEYMEAMQSEEIFGGDYTSYVELKYANKEIERLQQRIDKLEKYNQEIVDNYLKEDDCEYCDGRYAVAERNLEILKGSDSNE